MKRIYSLVFVFGLTLNAFCQVTKVLFIGNSYTYVNNLPQTIADIAISKGDTLVFDSNTPGGYTFNLHSTNATTISKINSQAWDFVVLQEQSQLPSFDPIQVANDVYPYAEKLDSMILSNDSCTETVFYMTWGRQNGDLSNCASYPPVCTYNGMQQRLRDSYLQMALNNHASTSPVGVAWKKVRDNYPGINLYQADESHPSIYGTYLAACVFYSSFYHKSAVGSSFLLPGITAADGLILQTIGSSVVLDSLALWQGNGDLPNSDFTYSSTGNVFQFTNTSDNATNYSWDFGDGNSSIQTDPQNTYSAPGQYIVSLTASSNCFEFIHYDTVTVNALGLQSIYGKGNVRFYPNPVKGQFYFDMNEQPFQHLELQIHNSIGQLVQKKEFMIGSQLVNDISSFTDGIYFVLLYSDGQLIHSQKMIIEK